MASRKRKKPGDYAVVHPWSAAGPGWANSGLYIRVPGEKGDGDCVYVEQLGPQAYALFPVALAAIGALTRAIQREGYAPRRPR